MITDWMPLLDESTAVSPSLLIYPDRVAENLRRMIARVGDPARLRPHLKTHKLPQLIALQVSLGITKAKCATIAEAEMAARAGATDILLAAQLVGFAIFADAKKNEIQLVEMPVNAAVLAVIHERIQVRLAQNRVAEIFKNRA